MAGSAGRPTGEVVEGARQHSSRRLGVQRQLVAAARIEWVVRGRSLVVEPERVDRPFLVTGRRIEAERDEIVSERWIRKGLVGNRTVAPFAQKEDGPGRLLARAVRQRHLAPGGDGLVGRREGQPMLPFRPQREVGREQIRLGEIKADAAIERRPAGMRAGGASATEKIDVVVLAVDARFLFRAIAGAEVQPPMLALRDGHARAHFGSSFRAQDFDVDELKQFHAMMRRCESRTTLRRYSSPGL